MDMGADVNGYAALSSDMTSEDPERMGEYTFSYTPIHLAIVKNDLDKVRLLPEKGANGDNISAWDAGRARNMISLLNLVEKYRAGK